jgi:hypothetical protein
LELHSEEVATLVDGLLARKALFDRHGIRWGTRSFVDKASLPELVQTLIDSPHGELAEVLGDMRAEQVIALGRRVDLSQLDALLSEWLSNADRADEGYWQDLLARNAWVFSQLTGAPVVLLQEKAYVGGKGIENTGGGEIDFLVSNALTTTSPSSRSRRRGRPSAPACTGRAEPSRSTRRSRAGSCWCSATATASRSSSTTCAPAALTARPAGSKKRPPRSDLADVLLSSPPLRVALRRLTGADQGPSAGPSHPGLAVVI